MTRLCSYPSCLPPEASERLVDEICRELMGEEVPMAEKDLTDWRGIHGCTEDRDGG